MQLQIYPRNLLFALAAIIYRHKICASAGEYLAPQRKICPKPLSPGNSNDDRNELYRSVTVGFSPFGNRNVTPCFSSSARKRRHSSAPHMETPSSSSSLRITATETPVNSLNFCTDIRRRPRAARSCAPVTGRPRSCHARPVRSLSMSKLNASHSTILPSGEGMGAALVCRQRCEPSGKQTLTSTRTPRLARMPPASASEVRPGRQVSPILSSVFQAFWRLC